MNGKYGYDGYQTFYAEGMACPWRARFGGHVARLAYDGINRMSPPPPPRVGWSMTGEELVVYSSTRETLAEALRRLADYTQ